MTKHKYVLSCFLCAVVSAVLTALSISLLLKKLPFHVEYVSSQHSCSKIIDEIDHGTSLLKLNIEYIPKGRASYIVRHGTNSYWTAICSDYRKYLVMYRKNDCLHSVQVFNPDGECYMITEDYGMMQEHISNVVQYLGKGRPKGYENGE